MINQTRLTDESITAAFARRSVRGTPGEIRDLILAATLVTPQRQDGLRRLPSVTTRPAFRLVFATAAVAGTVLAVSLGIAGTTNPSPTVPPSLAPSPSESAVASQSLSPARSGRADAFVRPFAYVMPAGSTLDAPVFADRIYPFVENGGDPGSGPRGGGPPKGRGVTVVSAQEPLVHGTPNRIPIRTRPAEFLADLGAIGLVKLGEPSSTTLDGRPALVATVQRGISSDFHYAAGLSTHVPLLPGSRIIVVDVEGITVVVVVWAASEDELDAWLPHATAFVESITFDSVAR